MNDLDEDAVLLLESRRCDAISKGDLAALREILAPDYLHVHANGRIDDLATYFEALEARPRRVERGQLVIRCYPGAAILVGEQYNYADEQKSVVVAHQVAVMLEGKPRFVSTQVTRKS